MDGLGLLLAALAVLWTIVASLGRPDARPWPVVVLLVGATILVGAARWAPQDLAARLPGAVAIAVAGSFVLGFPEVLRAGGAPTGYANANATLASLGAVGAVAAATTGPRRFRPGWFLLAGLLVAAVGSTRSMAGLLALGSVAAMAIGSAWLRSATLAAAGGLVAVSLALGVTTAVAAGGDPLGLGDRSELRGELWASALDAAREHPLRGLGPGGYERLGPVSTDPDQRWAHHGYLQQAADQGVPGLLLLLGLIGWAYARLWTGRAADTSRTVVGASALTVVCLHASVDHVLHHAAVPLVAALLLGWALAVGDDPLRRPRVPAPPDRGSRG